MIHRWYDYPIAKGERLVQRISYQLAMRKKRGGVECDGAWEQKVNSTQCSQAVSHPSTNWAGLPSKY